MVVAGLRTAERQLRHIVLVGLLRRLDDLLTHNNELTGCSTVPTTLGIVRMDCWVGIWKYSPVNYCKAGLLQFFCEIPESKQEWFGVYREKIGVLTAVFPLMVVRKIYLEFSAFR